MKKLISILLSLVIISSSVTAFAGVVEDLKAAKVLPENVTYSEYSSELMTRAEFAQMTARILTGKDMEKTATNFSDVDENNEYSGYISYLANCGIINGTGGANFLPDSYIEIGAINKMIVTVLGYKELAEKKGGYPYGYNSIAADLNLYAGVNAEGNYLTKYNAAVLVHNALFTEMFDSVNYEKGSTLLCKHLGISAYVGEIVDSQVNERRAKFRVDKNKFEDNPEILDEGTVANFTATRTVNVSDFERVPSTIWVDREGVIVNIVPKGSVDIIYGYVSKINGDANEESSYPASNLKKLMFVNDEEEYDFADNVLVKYNNEYQTSAVKMCNRFIKAVLISDEITFVESWDISSGGLITSIGENDITYICGEKTGSKLENIYGRKSLKVYLNNKSADFADLRKNSVFDYYETDDELVIIATEKSYTEYLDRYTQNFSVVVGETEYLTDDTFYVSKDEVNYKTTTPVSDLLGKYVKLFIAPNGYAKYITLAEESASDEFYGIVTGTDTDLFGETADVKMYKIVGSKIEDVVYKITEKTQFNDLAGGLSELNNSLSDKLNASSVFVFKTNDKGEITSVKYPTPFHGTTLKGSDSITFSEEGSTITATFGTNLVHFKNDLPVIALYEADGALNVRKITVANLYSLRGGSNAKLKLMGEEKTESAELILICGDDLSKYYPAAYRYGFYVGRNSAIDADGEVCSEIRIIDYKGMQNYMVSDELADKIETATGGAGLIQFSDTMLFSNDKVRYITTLAKLGSRYDEWLDENTSLRMGTVEKIAGTRIYFDDGSAHYISPIARQNVYVRLNENTAQSRFKFITIDDVKSGDVVFYRITNKYITGMIVAD